MLLLFFDKSDFEQEKFVIHQNNLGSTVVFMPLNKRMTQPSGKMITEKSDKDRKLISYDVYQKALERRNKAKKYDQNQKKSEKIIAKKSQKISQEKNKQVVKEKSIVVPIKKSMKAPTTMYQEKSQETVKAIAAKKSLTALEKSQIKKTVIEKENVIETKVIDQKKIVDKKVLENKQVEKIDKKIAEKKEVKSEVVQEVKIDPVVVSEKMIEDRKIENRAPEMGTVKKETDLSVIENNFDLEDDLNIDFDNISFVGRYDFEKNEIARSIKKEIEKYWKSPIGASQSAACELSVQVGLDGTAKKVTIKKGSGSLVFDMSARAAVYQSHFRKEICGKEFIIVLGVS